MLKAHVVGANLKGCSEDFHRKRRENRRELDVNRRQIVRAACLQNETAPKSLNSKTKNGPKNDPKLSRKILSLVLLCRISHRHYSKIFHREFPHKIKYFFTTRICRHGHAKNRHNFRVDGRLSAANRRHSRGSAAKRGPGNYLSF